MQCEAIAESGKRCRASALRDADGRCLFHSQTEKAIAWRSAPKRSRFISREEILRRLIQDLRSLNELKIPQAEKIKTRLRLVSIILELLKETESSGQSTETKNEGEEDNGGEKFSDKVQKWFVNQQ